MMQTGPFADAFSRLDLVADLLSIPVQEYQETDEYPKKEDNSDVLPNTASVVLLGSCSIKFALLFRQIADTNFAFVVRLIGELRSIVTTGLMLSRRNATSINLKH